jgi:uncharacterized protein (DUF1800 family)
MSRADWPKAHLLRRAAFSASPDEWAEARAYSYDELVDWLVDYGNEPDDVEMHLGDPAYVLVTPPRGASFSPNTVISDARQRWLFRMVHTRRPLEEKMTLFWHNFFATAYGKIAGIYGGTEATRMIAARPSEDPGRAEGHVVTLRKHATGNFRELLTAVAKDPAVLVWLDGRTNIRTRPQENFARELMELFSVGIGFHTESDVYAGARVFTGWNLQRTGATNDPAGRYEFVYNASQHDTGSKTFSFPVYANGSRVIPARSASDGVQDGLDLIDALARHPETARRLARRLFAFFVSEAVEPPAGFVERLAGVYLSQGLELKPVLRELFQSPEFTDPRHFYSRCSWPVEFVVRCLKEAGWTGYSLADAATPLAQMGQVLFDPPSVGGWRTGTAWFASASMLARMNFAAALARSQRSRLAAELAAIGRQPSTLVSYLSTRLLPVHLEPREHDALLAYVQGSGSWTGSTSQIQTKVGGLVHLILGSAEYQVL